ncbi:hypothetical protein DPMN_075369 [Dreissena polymorpha]|uniref:Uncharacterized protein n=1 Tax=Dreissena polymorpha TaxID=45954 RepID=A0A9D3YLJ1_DREPO|nr:hypothetical protein DPMN_075369 [Dreissena polymorpha]
MFHCLHTLVCQSPVHHSLPCTRRSPPGRIGYQQGRKLTPGLGRSLGHSLQG